MEANKESISVIDPLTPAFERVKTMLFRPFRLEKWLALGFCAWLAFLGSAGGGGGTGTTPGGSNIGSVDGVEDIKNSLQTARDWVVSNWDWLIQLAFVVGVLVVGLWLLLLWLSSRGRFMFLYCVAGNRAEVARPWNEYAAQGNSLFVFRLVLSLAMLILVLPFLAGAGWYVVPMIAAKQAETVGVVMAVVLALLAVGVGLLGTVVARLTHDFVTPIMYLRALSCSAGWKEFRSLMGQHFGVIILYLLFQVVIQMVIQLGILLLVLVTCCIAGCLLAIPYVGTVLLLPVYVFERSYSLYFLAQFGPRFNVFYPETEPSS